jgi:branched-chain amino acid transport system substrate-binding protein
VKVINPDVLYVSGYYADSAILIRQARDIGLQVPILGNSSVEDQKFIDVAGNAAEGLVYPLATGYDVTAKDSRTRQFVESFQRKFSEQPGWVEAQAYDAIGVLCQASKIVTEGPTGEKLKKALDNLGTFQGITGEIRFDQNGDVVGKPVRLRVIRSAKFANLDE